MKRLTISLLVLVLMVSVIMSMAEENGLWYTCGDISFPIPEGSWNRKDSSEVNTVFYQGEYSSNESEMDVVISFISQEVSISVNRYTKAKVYDSLMQSIQKTKTNIDVVIEDVIIAGFRAKKVTYNRNVDGTEYPVCVFVLLLDDGCLIMGACSGCKCTRDQVEANMQYICHNAINNQVHATTESEVLFRGVEWGIPVTEIASRIADVDLDHYTENTIGMRPITEIIYDKDGVYYDGAMGYTVKASNVALKELKVAGYPITNMDLEFVSIPGSDGLLTGNPQDTAFVYATYYIKPKNGDSAYNDLLKKLISLYGDQYETYIDDIYVIYTNNIWRDEKGSILCLRKCDPPNGDTYIHIIYAAWNNEQLLLDAYNALKMQEQIDAGSSIDGL